MAGRGFKCQDPQCESKPFTTAAGKKRHQTVTGHSDPKKGSSAAAPTPAKPVEALIDLDEFKELQDYLDEVEGAMNNYFAVESCVLRYQISEQVDAVCTYNGLWRIALRVK